MGSIPALVFVLIVAFACRDEQTAAPSRSVTPAPTRPPITTGVSTGSLQHGGLARGYRLLVPATAASGTNEVPLVLALHGGLGTPNQFATTSKFDTIAEREGFIVVYPEGVDRTWNGGRCCGQAVVKRIDDAGFLGALIEDLTKRLPVDPKRIFVTGHSNGAIMAFRFACERPELVAAIVPVAGSLEIPDCKADRGVSLLAIHGDADQNHPIGGGIGPRSIAGVPFTSMEESLARWTMAMKCAANDVATSGVLTTRSWSGCRDGVLARYTIIAGADHPWPGSAPLSPGLQGNPSQALDASEAAWAFFKSVAARP